ncbi:MAG: hypothetical protein PHH28_05910 [Desulfuromonadaceae bacterium]|nr:hypothetical protein [Desulfuromonadaceae bacterium]
MKKVSNRLILLIFSSVIFIFINSCSTIGQPSYNNNLPIFSQNELAQPYTQIGRIRVTRETYGSDFSLSPDIKAWGLAAVQQAAGKMGADAVMSLEITGRTTYYGIIPSTEYCATAFAIKFK